MKPTFDRNFFTQIGLDSGALTMLGTVVHSFGHPGEYRGSVHKGDGPEATFFVSVDEASAVAQVTIDLAGLVAAPAAARDCGCGDTEEQRFVVHPKGYAVFHVSGGSGGYWVNVRRADEDPDLRAYDSRELQPGDIFSAVLLRPGRYSLRNELSAARADVTVPYPVVGKTAYTPPAPVSVEAGEAIEPRELRLHPAQGLNVHVLAPARLRIELEEPDDGPRKPPRPGRSGWKKSALPRT